MLDGIAITTKLEVYMDNEKTGDFTIKIGGKLAYCPNGCGCNVYSKPDESDLNLYQCNGCGCQFMAS